MCFFSFIFWVVQNFAKSAFQSHDSTKLHWPRDELLLQPVCFLGKNVSKYTDHPYCHNGKTFPLRLAKKILILLISVCSEVFCLLEVFGREKEQWYRRREYLYYQFQWSEQFLAGCDQSVLLPLIRRTWLDEWLWERAGQ